jgi:hypothetical protein
VNESESNSIQTPEPIKRAKPWNMDRLKRDIISEWEVVQLVSGEIREPLKIILADIEFTEKVILFELINEDDDPEPDNYICQIEWTIDNCTFLEGLDAAGITFTKSFFCQNTQFFGSGMNFSECIFKGDSVFFDNTQFCGKSIQFTDTEFYGETLKFTESSFYSSQVKFFLQNLRIQLLFS